MERSTDNVRPVIWTVSVSRLTRLLTDVIPEFDHRADIQQMNLGFAEAVEAIKERLQREPCDVLIAGGSNGAYLRGRVDVPLVSISATGFDLMEALARARRIGPRIGIVTHAADVPPFEDFQKSFGLEIDHRRFVTVEDARNCIAELVRNGTQVVVGTGMAIDLAEAAGLPGVLLYSIDSVRTAFERAIELTHTVARSSVRSSPTKRSRVRTRELHGTSTGVVRLRERIGIYAPHTATVLISGDTGTGKELVARNLHVASHRRGRFVAVNCGALSESLLEAELFGYSEGAFTGARRGGRVGLVEAADGGTLFLDEIGELPLPLQTRLLRVLEEREVQRVGSTVPIPVDVRVVAASLNDLDTLVEAGRFRRDLLYRLSVLRIHVPTLAERQADIDVLIDYFFAQGPAAPQLSDEARSLLRSYSWPGNVRQLRNVVDRISVHWLAARPALVDVSMLNDWVPELLIRPAAGAATRHASPHGGATDSHTTGTFGRKPDARALAELLLRVNGNRDEASRILGVSRTTLWRWLRLADQSQDVIAKTGNA